METRDYESRVEAYEAQGMTRSDAQGCADTDDMTALQKLATECVSLRARVAELEAALEAAIERMESVADRIPVVNRANGVSQATHVMHMAGHLAQHAKIARAALKGAK